MQNNKNLRSAFTSVHVLQTFNPTCSKYRVIEEHDLPGYAGILSAPALTSVARESLQNDAPGMLPDVMLLFGILR